MIKVNRFLINSNTKVILSICALMILTMSCQSLKHVKADLQRAENKKTTAFNNYKISADSCLYFYGNEMPERIRNSIFSRLPANTSKIDSVYTLVIKVNDVLGLLKQQERPNLEIYNVLVPVEKSGQNALKHYETYIKARQAVRKYEDALRQAKFFKRNRISRNIGREKING